MATRKVDAFQIAARIDVEGKRAQAVLRDTEKQAKSTTSALGKLSGTVTGPGRGSAGSGSGGGLLDGITDMLQSLPGLGMLAGGLTKVAGAAKGAVSFGFDFNRVMEEGHLAFEVMLKDGQKAKALMKEIDAMSVDSPFDFPILVEAAQTVKAFKFETSEVTRILTDAGDASRGVQDKFEGIILALGQMKTKGKVSAEEMLQLVERQVPAWNYVADAIAKVDKNFAKLTEEERTASVQKMAERGQLNAARTVEAILRGIEDDFGGLGKRVANETASGLESQLRDAGRRAAGASTTGLFGGYKDALRVGIATVGSDTVMGLANSIGEGTQHLVGEGAKMGVALIKGTKDILGIESPSKVYHSIGGNVVEGFENGLVDRTSRGFDRWSKALEKAGGEAFVRAIENIAQRLGIDPAHLMNMIAAESRFNLRAKNPLPGQSASGLFQATNATARGLGFASAAELRNAPMEVQVRALERYLKQRGVQPGDSLAQVYGAVGYGTALRNENTPLFKRGSEKYRLNSKAWDVDRDGVIVFKELGQYAKAQGGFSSTGGFVDYRSYRQGSGDIEGATGVFIDRFEPEKAAQVVEQFKTAVTDSVPVVIEVKESLGELSTEIHDLSKLVNVETRPFAALPAGAKKEPGGAKKKRDPLDPRNTENAAQRGAQIMKGAWNSVRQIGEESMQAFASGIGAMTEAWVLLGNESDVSVKKMVASAFAGAAAQASVHAVMETAAGIAALTPWGAAYYGPAAAHFKAAALFAGIAVGTSLVGRGVAGNSFKDKTSEQSQQQQNEQYAEESNPANQFTRRATGGSAYKGRSYIVGDGGRPEVFEPDEDGYIHPSIDAYERKRAAVARLRRMSNGGTGMFGGILSKLASAIESLDSKISSASPDDIFTRTAKANPQVVAEAAVKGMDQNHKLIERMNRRLQPA